MCDGKFDGIINGLAKMSETLSNVAYRIALFYKKR